MYRVIEGMLFKVRGTYHSYLVEVYDKGFHNDALAEFCAKISAEGEHIRSIVRISATCDNTPKIPVLGTKTYNKYLKEYMRNNMEAKHE